MSVFGGIFSDHLEGTWDQAKGYLREHLEQLDAGLSAFFEKLLTSDGTLSEFSVLGGGASVPSYIANTGPAKAPKWDKVDVAQGVKSRLRYVNFTAATEEKLLLGRGEGIAGDWQEIQLGEGLEMEGTELKAPGSWAMHFFLMGG